MIVVIVASTGKNRELGDRLVSLGQNLGLKMELIDLCGLNLPLYTPEQEGTQIPVAAIDFTQRLKKAKGHFYVAPEYNGSVPPSLNNAIAWASRSGEDWREAFNAKPAALATHSGGGGTKVLLAMRQILSHLGMNVFGREIQTNFSKKLNEKSAEEILGQL